MPRSSKPSKPSEPAQPSEPSEPAQPTEPPQPAESTQSTETEESWKLFRNDPSATGAEGAKERRTRKGKGSEEKPWLEAPPWRQFQILPKEESNPPLGMGETYWKELDEIAEASSSTSTGVYSRGTTFRLPRDENKQPTDKAERILLAVNAAIRLRRPLLVTGLPGSGKTSLAYAIAAELGLGPVLVWPITPRSRLLEDGLYRYDALARLQQADLDRFSDSQARSRPVSAPDATQDQEKPVAPPIDEFIRLGPVGTAFLPSRWPRVLLIDEIDKGDLQLPNELLHLFEEGRYEISELTRSQRQSKPQNEEQPAEKSTRESSQSPYTIRTADAKVDSNSESGAEEPLTVKLRSGFVSCAEFPIVVMTSNREREFPPAFHRRCIRIGMPPPDDQVLTPIVEAHFANQSKDNQPGGQELRKEIEHFLGQVPQEGDAADGEASGAGPAAIRDRAVDQLLNALFLLTGQSQVGPDEKQRSALRDILYRKLSDPSDDPEDDDAARGGAATE